MPKFSRLTAGRITRIVYAEVQPPHRRQNNSHREIVRFDFKNDLDFKMLTSRISLAGPEQFEAEDYMASALGVVFTDNVCNQHGDSS
jgi:hypothetical protein